MSKYEFKFRGKKYYADAPMLTPDQLDRIIGASRTLNTRLIFVRGTFAKPVEGKLDLSRPGQIEEIPTGTVKG
jgi:hypothetical protein